MKPITRLALVAIALGLAGCAYRPIVDPKRSDMARYETDLAECRQIAEQAPGPGTGAAVGAAVGYGAGLGAAGGAGRAERDQRQVIRNCMTGRGHAVLN